MAAIVTDAEADRRVREAMELDMINFGNGYGRKVDPTDSGVPGTIQHIPAQDVIVMHRRPQDGMKVHSYGGRAEPMEPIASLILCPRCFFQHIDEGEFATRPHTSHSCQECGLTWKQAMIATVGVKFLPGTENNAGK